MGHQAKRRTEITIETRTMTIIRVQGGHPASAYCEDCGNRVKTFSPEHAALIFGVNASELLLFSESGGIHTAADGGLCSDSLSEFFKREIRYIGDRDTIRE